MGVDRQLAPRNLGRVNPARKVGQVQEQHLRQRQLQRSHQRIPSPQALATALAATVSSRSPSWKWSTLVAQPLMAIQILGAQLSSTRMEFMCLVAVIGNTVEANARQ